MAKKNEIKKKSIDYSIYSTKWITCTALLTAMVVALGYVPGVPILTGKIYWCDFAIYAAAYLLDPLAATIVGGIGTTFFDLFGINGTAYNAIPSLIIHGLQGFFAGLIFMLLNMAFNKRKKYKKEAVIAVLSSIIPAIIVILGYFIKRITVEAKPAEVAALKMPANVLQEFIGIAVATLICYAARLKKQLVKARLLPNYKEYKGAKNYMKSKKILTMQDLSCVGQCSLTVALPILSAYGVETCVLPTAVLSNHTMFDGWSYLDLTPEIKNIYSHWEKNGFKFEAFLLGYLGKKELMNAAEEAFDRFSEEGAPKIIDPCFGDNGKLYGGFDEEYVKAMANLLRRADIILPNITEASFLTGSEYKETYDSAYVEELIDKLGKITDGTVIITGVEQDGKIGEAIRTKGGETEYVFGKKLPVRYHGTGDIFAAVFTAKYLTGATFAKACSAAGKFVVNCLENTDSSHFYGVNFESVLKTK